MTIPASPPSSFLSGGDGRLRAVLMRAGTSRGLFLHLSDLPLDRSEWSRIILSAMGSPDGSNRKQLNGVGGGVSTQSKVAVCWKSEEIGLDVEYLFIQVPIDGGDLEFSGNCGNMASGVGPFAYDERLVSHAKDDDTENDSMCQMIIRNVNTGSLMRSTFRVNPHTHRHITCGTPDDIPLSGVTGRGSPIRLDFLKPSGSMTGTLLPTGSAIDTITLDDDDDDDDDDGLVGGQQIFTVTAIDSGNPFIFVPAEQFGLSLQEPFELLVNEIGLHRRLMTIRAKMAVKMGLAKSENDAKSRMGTPKIALIAPAPRTACASSSKQKGPKNIQIASIASGRRQSITLLDDHGEGSPILDLDRRSWCSTRSSSDASESDVHSRRSSDTPLSSAIDSSTSSSSSDVGAPSDDSDSIDSDSTTSPDILVRAWSMGLPHPTIQMTGAVCVATACATSGTLLWHMKKRTTKTAKQVELNQCRAGNIQDVAVTIGHASGTIKTACTISDDGEGDSRVESATVYRTARRLMEGFVYYD